MGLVVEIPGSRTSEQSYVAHCLLQEFLGLDFVARQAAGQAVRIHDGDGRELVINADLFTRPLTSIASLPGLPREPIGWWQPSEISAKLLDRSVPVLYGEPSYASSERAISLGVDIFGGAFFFLARIEEAVESRRDNHDRFAAVNSLAARYGLLHRPVVDEYVEILWACLSRLWPGLRRKRRRFRQNLTHDVDLLRFCLPRALVADLRNHGIGSAVADIGNWLSIRAGRRADPFDTFDLIMALDEAAGARSSFYFLTGWTYPLHDPSYVFDRPATHTLLSRIAARGHEIGLHPSYNTYLSSTRIARELARLRRVCDKLRISQECWGSRQHYLRWRTPDSFAQCEAAGLDYDSTLSFADTAGFRCGTCHEYPAFDLSSGRQLHLRERPLIAMDCSVLDTPYQGLGATAQAFDFLKGLKDTCRQYDGEFTVLWHNNRLADPEEAAFYRAVISS